MKRSAIVLGLFFLESAALAAPAARTVRDWTAVCGPQSCRAETTGAGGLAMGGQGYRLQIVRAAGPSAPWHVRFIGRKVAQPDGEGPATVRVDGAPLPAVALAPTGDGESFEVADAAALGSILAAMRKGAALDLAFAAGGGQQQETFSLSGLAAVMLWMDERQGRIGKPGNAAAAGDAGEGADLTSAAAADLREELGNASPVDGCQWMGEDADASAFGARQYDLGDGYTLYLVACTMGAYQPSTRAFLRGADQLEALPFADYGSDTGWGATLDLGTVDFDPSRRILHNYAKFRGVGDCGTVSDFQWNGYRFKLLEYRYKDCSGDPPAGEDAEVPEFPVIYRAK